MLKKKKAYAYLRVSTKMQAEEGYSLGAQREEIQKYADYANIDIVEWYTDEGVSGGSIAGRDKFQQMINDIILEKDNIEYVIIYSLSRFGRNTADNVETLQKLKDFNVNIYAIKEKIDSNSEMGEFLITILSAVAQMEKDNIRIQTLNGRFQKGRLGLWNGGVPPYGYGLEPISTDNKGKPQNKLIIIEDEAEIVRKIFDMFVNTNMGANGIANWLNKNGYKKKTRAKGSLDVFTPDFIKRTLDNRTYTGNLYYGRTKSISKKNDRSKKQRIKITDMSELSVCLNSHEAIISDELFEKAHTKRITTGKKYEKIEKDHTYILGTLVRCPMCGKPMYGVASYSKKRKDGTLYPPSFSYICRGKTKKPATCSFSHSYSAKLLESEVERIITNLSSDNSIRDSVVKQIDNEVDMFDLKERIKNIQKEIAKLNNTQITIENQLDNLNMEDSLYEHRYESLNRRLEGVFIKLDDFNSQLNELHIRLENVERNKLNQEKIYEMFKHFSDIYEKMSYYEKRQLMESFIESIELYPEKIKGHLVKSINFNFAISYNGSTTTQISLPKNTSVETVALLTHKYNVKK